MDYKKKKFKLKLLAIKDIITNSKFYLVTFNDKGGIKWWTTYGIDEDEIRKHF
jgi:hypothetical protein